MHAFIINLSVPVCLQTTYFKESEQAFKLCLHLFAVFFPPGLKKTQYLSRVNPMAMIKVTSVMIRVWAVGLKQNNTKKSGTKERDLWADLLRWTSQVFRAGLSFYSPQKHSSPAQPPLFIPCLFFSSEWGTKFNLEAAHNFLGKLISLFFSLLQCLNVFFQWLWKIKHQ